MLNIVVCVSGSGTNLQAIIDGIEDGRIPNTQIAAVFSNNAQAYALERAKTCGIKTVCISPKSYADRDAFNRAFCAAMDEIAPHLVVLAGFLVKIPNQMVQTYTGRILNVHPSLIPAFCGVGYYGLKVHEEALKRGVKITGATVHLVDTGMDTGKILLQKAVCVQEGDDAQALQKRVMEEAEWVILPQAIAQMAYISQCEMPPTEI